MNDLQELIKWHLEHPYVTVTYEGYPYNKCFNIEMRNRINGKMRSCMYSEENFEFLRLPPKLVDLLNLMYDELNAAQIGVNNHA